MSLEWQPLGDGFWNLRGPFRIGGLLDIGTHCSLVRLGDGGFALLDAYTLDAAAEQQLRDLTDGGRALRAVLHLHPFHTLHVRWMAERFPEAALHGCDRHVERDADLPWQPLRTTDPALHAQFADDLLFSVPAGVDLVTADPNLHFGSVLAIHRASRILHVDDTLSYLPLPLVGGIGFHPTLGRVLRPEPGAAQAFRDWARGLAELAEQHVDRIVPAHARRLPPDDGPPPAEIVRTALAKVEGTLSKHEKKHG